jgi:hypothetical protein
MAQEMTIDDAERIIGESFDFGADFDNAVNFLQQNDPDNAVLRGVRNNGLENERKIRAKKYAIKALAEEEYDGPIEEALALLKDDKAVQQEADEAKEIFDKENHIEMADEEAVLRNAAKIDEILSEVNYESVRSGQNYPDINQVMDNVEVIDNTTSFDDEENDTPKSKEDYWSVAIETAKQQAMMLRTGDQNFFMKKEQEKRDTLQRDISNFFFIGLGQGVAADAMSAPTEEDLATTANQERYVNRESQKALEAMNKLWGENQGHLAISTDSILTNAVETSKKADSYNARWEQKGFSRVAKFLRDKKAKFDGFLKGIWGKRAEIKKNTIEHIKNNKWRLIVDTAATAAVALTASTGLAMPVVAGYALYSAAGSWVWPVVERKAKEVRAAKAAGRDAKEWRGLSGLKKAFAAIKSNKDEYRKYKNRAYTGTAAGILGAGVVSGMGAASNWAVQKAGYMAAKVTSSVIRSAGSVTSQIMNYRDVKADFKADPSAENRAKLQDAKIGLGLGAVIAFAGNMYSFGHVLESNSTENGESGGILSKIKSLFAPKGEDRTVEAPDTTATAGVGAGIGGADGKEVDGVAAAEAVAATPEVVVPDEYNSDMGISEAHWNEMHRKLTGIYENHAEIFGKENVASADAWENMYANIENARADNPSLFGNDTNEQVLYKYMKLIENTERVQGGPKGYLVTRLAKDGLPTYGSKDMTETMRALNKIIICGEKPNISADKITGVLDNVDERTGAYTGAGAGIGVTSNRYIGGRADCNEYQNAWEKAHRMAPKKVKAPAISEVVANKEPEQADASVDQTLRNEEVAEPDANITETTVNKANGVDIYQGATNGNLNANGVPVEQVATVPAPEGVEPTSAENGAINVYEGATNHNLNANDKKVISRLRSVAVANSGNER